MKCPEKTLWFPQPGIMWLWLWSNRLLLYFFTLFIFVLLFFSGWLCSRCCAVCFALLLSSAGRPSLRLEKLQCRHSIKHARQAQHSQQKLSRAVKSPTCLKPTSSQPQLQGGQTSHAMPEQCWMTFRSCISRSWTARSMSKSAARAEKANAWLGKSCSPAYRATMFHVSTRRTWLLTRRILRTLSILSSKPISIFLYFSIFFNLNQLSLTVFQDWEVGSLGPSSSVSSCDWLPLQIYEMVGPAKLLGSQSHFCQGPEIVRDIFIGIKNGHKDHECRMM